MASTLGFLASHGATSARAIHHACRTGRLDATSGVLICNNAQATALVWAHERGVPARHLSARTHPDPEQLDNAIRDTLVEHEVDLVVLSGYLKMLGPRTIDRFRNRILNVHPAPLPEFGGRGMYGLHVHQAVLDAGRENTAVTVHLVDEEYDHGPIVHTRPLPIEGIVDPEELQRAVAEIEPEVLIEALDKIVAGEIDLGAHTNVM